MKGHYGIEWEPMCLVPIQFFSHLHVYFILEADDYQVRGTVTTVSTVSALLTAVTAENTQPRLCGLSVIYQRPSVCES